MDTVTTPDTGATAGVGPPTPADLHARTVAWWSACVAAVRPDQWDARTPCRDWRVRDLVNHVVSEERWAVPLLEGSTIEDVGDRFDGDLLGDDPHASADDAARSAADTATRTWRDDARVHLSYGEESAGEYLLQLAADHLVHGWDLAVATGQARSLDPDLVRDVAAWFREREEMYRSGGAVGARRALTGDPQTDLLAAFGRDAAWGADNAGFDAFVDAFGSGDVDAIMALMTDDCAFEATGPAPDGVRHEGADAVRAVWVELFTQTPEPRFTEEESFVSGDRAVLRWRFDWGGDEPGHVRGVDVVRLRDGRVCEKLSYVKG